MKTVYSLYFLLFCSLTVFGQLNLDQLLVENKMNPKGIDVQAPRFSWIMSSKSRNKSQSAYQIRVVKGTKNFSNELLTWDTEKIASDQSVFVDYEGPNLESGATYHWQVRVWDEKGKVSHWSTTSSWQMGFLNPQTEFSAKWITPGYEETKQRESPLFRKEFETYNKKIKIATVFVTAHGMYEAFINGKRLGDAYFTPGWTSYNKRLQYQVYDITNHLVTGKNAIGAMLGNGWYRGFLAWGDRNNHYGDDIALLLQMTIEYEDGTTQEIITDDSWQSTKGPVVFSEIYDGETYDTQQEIYGWSKPNFSEQWESVKETDFAKKNLIATENELIKKQEQIKPVDRFETKEGGTIIDFGQNLVGWVQLSIKGKPGQRIEIYHAEVLDKEGNFYIDNLRDADQKITYILDGTEQLLEPHFTFQGFRYIKITGDTVKINDKDLTAIALYSDMKPTGKFSTSDPLINKLQQNIKWGQKGNFIDVPTDCPQRDERLGWTGDAQAFFNTAAYNMNVNNFFSKWMKDVAIDQLESGAVPHVVPNVLGENASGSAGWADAATIIPWNSYLLYGDYRMLETQYPSMKSWVDYIVNQSQDNLWASGFHFGDWLFYRPDDDNDGRAAITDKYYITQCFFANSTQLVINAAKVLGHEADVKKYQALLKDIKKAFQNEFVTNSGRVGPNTQTAYVLALQFDMLPESQREQAVDRLVDNIKRYGYHLTTGFLGTPYLCHVLSRFGREDMAYELLMQDTYPSWLYPVTMGATTIWERWDGIKPDGSFQTPGMNSYNHYAYGAIGEWMYQNISGINADPLAPGYKRIKIKPILGGGLTEASGSLETYYGTIKSAWKYEGKYLKQQITVPVNTRAEVYLLSEGYTQIKEGKKPIESQTSIEFLSSEAGYSKVLLGSGSYDFSIPIQENLASNRLNEIIGDYTAFTGFGSDFSVINEGEKLYIVLKENKEELIPRGEDTYVFASNPEYIFEIQRSRAQSIRSVRVEIGEMRYNAAKD